MGSSVRVRRDPLGKNTTLPLGHLLGPQVPKEAGQMERSLPWAQLCEKVGNITTSRGVHGKSCFRR
jgi:hypothetical protein